ncbi:elongation factor P hydroxylase [Motilimonas sp. 1_MG-2023]|uniref:elongation factor P hydroxylase n=1 Tax=Motilimonas TaxID=1914248 RepID=UPI0026E3E01C|nr:elongation factor P hydroxylase [Motilimonas sp. 1_MG-2023]MDO6526789.1 elongation factor P hydroxylase [Motilimonas sp. 1_MG-2023]
MHHYQDLIAIFEQCFLVHENTQLVAGEGEPIYLPADEKHAHHRIIFAHGFFASALHEISHWCIAGKKRRLLVDFGYWYEPDGRNEQQQAAFEQVEIKPQAVEWALAVSCGFDFSVSCDNLSGIEIDRLGFQHRVYDQVLIYLEQGFPARAQLLINALGEFYGVAPLQRGSFDYRGMYLR